MTESKRCLGCYGSGKVRGLGNMDQECEQCEGKGKIYEIKDEIEELNIRHTASYNNAIEEIKSQIPYISHDAAQKIFDDELRKVNKPKGRK